VPCNRQLFHIYYISILSAYSLAKSTLHAVVTKTTATTFEVNNDSTTITIDNNVSTTLSNPTMISNVTTASNSSVRNLSMDSDLTYGLTIWLYKTEKDFELEQNASYVLDESFESLASCQEMITNIEIGAIYDTNDAEIIVSHSIHTESKLCDLFLETRELMIDSRERLAKAYSLIDRTYPGFTQRVEENKPYQCLQKRRRIYYNNV
jgi:hypothetical protein